jgi:hypothetical protein
MPKNEIRNQLDGFLLAVTVQNLKKLAQQRYNPPDQRIGVTVYAKSDQNLLNQKKSTKNVDFQSHPIITVTWSEKIDHISG